MNIYIICPVRNISAQQRKEINDYAENLSMKSHVVHNPLTDVDQDDPTGITICLSHANAMLKADEVHIFWDVTSSGSHFDLGMAFILKKRLVLVQSYQKDRIGKSYEKVIKSMER